MSQYVEVVIYPGAGKKEGCCIGQIFGCLFKILAGFLGLIALRGCIG